MQAFINLVQRHEQSFYNFVHKVHSKGEGLFDGLIKWTELVLTVMREGLAGDPISLEFLLPHTGQDRLNIIHDVDAFALYHYRMKLAYENKLRKRFGRLQKHDAEAEEDATQQMVDDVAGEFDFGELVSGDAHELQAENSEDEPSDDEDSSEFESASDETDETESGSDSEETHASPPTGKALKADETPSKATRPPPLTNHSSTSHHSRAQSEIPSPSRLTSPASTSHPSRSSLDGIRRAPSSASSVSRNSNKPLPPSPAKDRPSHASHVNLPRSLPRRRKGPEAGKQPELRHLADLLPIFIEMVSGN
jgi:hypothetical protein